MSEPAFQAGATSFDLSNALISATASNLAYESDRALLRQKMRPLGFKKVYPIRKEGTELFVACSDEAILVAFRGTEDMTDWGTNAQFRLAGGPLGMVHEGFVEALGLVWRKVVEKITDYQNDGQGVWFCGHSLGGALATLATARYLEQAWPVRGLYTFGSPRVGNPGFEQNFNQQFQSRAFRFVHNNDIVTRVPKRIMGYRHVGVVQYFDRNGNLEAGPSGWDSFVDRFRGRIDAVFTRGLDGIKDHDMDTYEAMVQKAWAAEADDE